MKHKGDITSVWEQKVGHKYSMEAQRRTLLLCGGIKGGISMLGAKKGALLLCVGTITLGGTKGG